MFGAIFIHFYIVLCDALLQSAATDSFDECAATLTLARRTCRRGRWPNARAHLCWPAARSARRRQAAPRLLRCAPPASPGRTLRVRLEVTAPFRCSAVHPWSLLSEAGPPGRLAAAKTMEAKSLSRAQRSRLARERATRASGLGLDGEPGSGTADLQDRGRGCVTPLGRWPRSSSRRNVNPPTR